MVEQSLRPVVLAERTATVVLFLFLLLASLTFVAYGFASLTFRFSLDYGEAPLMDQAMRLLAVENIYRPDLSTPPFTVANYPPGYVALVAPLVSLFGPTFGAGRIISLLSSLLVALSLTSIVHALDGERKASLITGLLFLSSPFVTHWSSLMRIDLLALAFSVGSLTVLARRPMSRTHVIVAAVLMVAAIFTRQSYALAAPLAGFVWLWQNDDAAHKRATGGWRARLARKEKAIVLALVAASLTLLLLMSINLATRGGFIFNVVEANINEFGLDRLEGHLGRLIDTSPALLAAALTFLVLAPGRIHSWTLPTTYLLAAFAASLTIGKIGSNVNYFLELIAALSLVTGTLFAWANERPWIRTFILLALAVQVAWHTLVTYDEFVTPVLGRLGQAEELAEMEAMVASAEGPVLADEHMGLITLQGQPLYMQPFEVTQLSQAGIWSQDPLLASLEYQEFDLILVYHHPEFPLHEERWTQEMRQSIGRHYQLTGILADTYIYRPRMSGREAQQAAQRCAGAPWLLPSSSKLGAIGDGDEISFYGLGDVKEVPVHAVADGSLTRESDWHDRVAILHDDPLRPGQQIWSVYAHMSGTLEEDSYVHPDYPPGSRKVPVVAGQTIGYQGVWSGRSLHRSWLHLQFILVDAVTGDQFPASRSGRLALPAAEYLGIEQDLGQLRPIQCSLE